MLLEVQGLTAGYAGTTIVHDVSFSIGEGETLSLLGRNGMGKTTLLRAIFGLAERYAGAVRVDGELMPPRRPEALARRGLSLVPDDRGVFPNLSVAENLRLAALSAGRHAAVADPLEMFPELGRRPDQPAGQLSGGLQQQLALARALAAGPRLIAIDELSHGIQPSIVVELANRLVWITETFGVAALVVEQNLDLALRVTDRALIMQKGAIVADAPSAVVAEKGARYLDLLVI